MTESVEQQLDPLDQCPGGLLEQRFRLLELLGSGPVHRAYRALDEQENVEVCLKIPRPRFRKNDGFASRYRRDLLDVMTYADRNWVLPRLIVEHDGVPFQVLPLIEGDPLPDWFEKAQRNEQRLLTVLTRAIKALDRLQRVTGRIHGTIKPSNLWVEKDDEPLFLDLAATGRLEDHFAEKARSGRPVYSSPEQLSGERADTSSDLYCLALVVYQALAKRHPFFGTVEGNEPSSPERLLTSLLDQLKARPPAPSSFNEDVPLWADRFLTRCLHPDPTERFATHREAVLWLKNHTKQEQELSAQQRLLPPAGREQEMRFLLDLMENLVSRQRGGEIVRLSGELGCGKTRCVEWLVEKTKDKKVRVAVVEPTPESGLHLQSVLSELCRDYPHLAFQTQPVVESLLGIAVEEPLLLVIKDVQQADDTLVEFFKELQSVMAEVPLLLLLVEEESSFRSSEMKAFVTGLQHSLRLEPLDRRAIANLIEERSWTPPTASVSSWVHRVSGGNALHATLLVEFLQQNDYVSDAVELSWKESPPIERPTLQEAVIWKLSGIGVLARTILETAAVLGNTFRLTTLNAINYRTEDEVDEALGEGVSKGLVELLHSAGATSYRWKHAKFRQGLLRDIHARRKQRIHRLAAAFYSRGESDPSRVAYHFLEAGDTPELFYWGSLAVEQALEQRRRGECNFWMNVLLTRIPEQEWLGPDIHRARSEVSRDQSASLDLAEWSRWLRTLSGRPPGPADSTDPLLQAQRTLSSSLAWPKWKERVAKVASELRALEGAGREKALEFLELEWMTRSAGREPFPALSN